MSILLSIDPGNKKCGLLLADIKSGNVIEAGICTVKSFSYIVSLWNSTYLIDKVLIGNGTNSKFLEQQLKQKDINNLNFINEKNSTLRARFRFWEIWPPNYLIRWLPRGIILPPDNLDAVVALILIEDFLQTKLNWPENVNIKILPEQ